MKKFLTISIMSLLFVASVGSTQALAVETVAPIEKPTNTQSIQITPRAEQFKWYYRIYNGVYQRRLWSLTEAEWLNEWTNI